jgi:transposase
MNMRKVTSAPSKGKSLLLENFDHYVAVDWSERTMAVAHVSRRRTEPVVFERPADLKSLREYLRTLHGSTILTFEETTTAHWLYLELCDCVERIIICNPYRNRLLSDGPKTDKIDAAKLCLLLRTGAIKEVFHSDDKLFELRCLVSAYTDLIRAGVRMLNQRTAVTRAHTDTGTHASFILEHLDKSIEAYQQSKHEYETKFTELSRRNTQLKRLMAVSGIGTIGAVKILAAVVDARRFPRTGHYWSYCGLVTHEKSSGGRSYGRRKAQYNHALKAVYKIAALSAIKGKNPIHEYYDSLLARGMETHNARHQVARYIAQVTYGMLKTGTPYDPYRWRNNTTRQQVA